MNTTKESPWDIQKDRNKCGNIIYHCDGSERPGYKYLSTYSGRPGLSYQFSANENQVIIGASWFYSSAFASAGIAISLYPVLKKYNEALALGSVGFRVIEGVFYIVGVVGLLSLLTLSQEYVKAGASECFLISSLRHFVTGGTKHGLASWGWSLLPWVL